MNTKERHKSRRLALQALYQWQIAGSPAHEIESQFRADKFFQEVDQDYFLALLHFITKNKESLDELLKPLLDRKLTELDPIELTILRIGSYELAHRPEIPYKVVINESIKLAKLFGAEDSHKFINGILDKLSKSTRKSEVS